MDDRTREQGRLPQGTAQLDCPGMDDDPIYTLPDDEEPRGMAAWSNRMRWIVTGILIALAIISAVPLRGHFSTPEAHQEVIATIDQKIDNVLTLTAGSAGASALISALPGDAGSPIADKLMDLGTGFLIVLAALFLEKYLITIFSATALGIVIPLALGAGIFFVWGYGRRAWAASPLRIGLKLAAIAAVLLVAIPTSSWVTNQIDTMYQTSMQETLDSAEALAAGSGEAEEQGEDGIIGFFQGIFETVSSGVSGALEGAQQSLNQFIESLAVMLVTSCLIPILVLLFYFWMAKILLGVNIDVPLRALSPRAVRRRASNVLKGSPNVRS